ncbi:MAG: hypothetical protein AB7G11_00930 [Phycisphaerales bacterium]
MTGPADTPQHPDGASRPSRHWVRDSLALALVLAAAAAIAWFAGVRWQFEPKNFGIVEPGVLYRSAALTPAALRRVHDLYHIRTIVDLGAYDRDPVGGVIAQRTADALGIKRFVFPLEGDGTGDPNAYVRALRIIASPANQPVLVHCATGSQRTSGCVILYQQIIHGDAFDPAYDQAKSFKHDPTRNPRLKPYLLEWHDRIAQAYRSGAVVPGYRPSDAVDGGTGLGASKSGAGY